MSICNSCGGVIGRDFFNPQECEWISYRQEQEQKQEINNLRSRIQYLENKVSKQEAV